MDKAPLNSAALMEIIRAQTEIARLGSDLGAMMELIAGRVQEMTRAQGAIVELAEESEMVYRAASGMAHHQLGLRLKRDGSLSGLCVERGEILYCRDAETDERVDREACRRVGLLSMMVAPLAYSGRPVGVLKIASSAKEAFTPRDTYILELMTGLIAAQIYHASDFNDLHHRATHDALTGIANRARFYDRLRQDLRMAERRRTQVGILNLDMDGLKPINDVHGHRAGDAALCEIAARMQRVCRQTDTVARLGGDEFGIILAEVKDRGGAELQAGRIQAEIDAPFRFEDQPLRLGASLGISIFPEDGTDLHGLIEKADQAMYDAKRTRKAAVARN